jgi:hypothetical protein
MAPPLPTPHTEELEDKKEDLGEERRRKMRSSFGRYCLEVLS